MFKHDYTDHIVPIVVSVQTEAVLIFYVFQARFRSGTTSARRQTVAHQRRKHSADHAYIVGQGITSVTRQV